MDFVIVDSVGYYTPLGRNRDSSARFRSIRFTDLIAAEATRGNDTLLLLFLFIYRRKFREKQSFYSTIPFLQKKKSKINKLISREIRVQFIRIDRSQKREREKKNSDGRNVVPGKFPCEWFDASFRGGDFIFREQASLPLPPDPAGHDWHGVPGTRVCRPTPWRERERESSIGVAGTGGERAMATRQEGSSTLPPQSLLRH